MTDKKRDPLPADYQFGHAVKGSIAAIVKPVAKPSAKSHPIGNLKHFAHPKGKGK